MEKNLIIQTFQGKDREDGNGSKKISKYFFWVGHEHRRRKLFDESGKNGPHDLVRPLLGRLSLQVKVKQIPTKEFC
jgi:hypothetical protein